MDVHSQPRSEHVLDAEPRPRLILDTDGPATRRSPGSGHWIQQRSRRSDRPSPQRRGGRGGRSRAARRSGPRVVESIRAEGGEAMAALANLADARSARRSSPPSRRRAGRHSDQQRGRLCQPQLGGRQPRGLAGALCPQRRRRRSLRAGVLAGDARWRVGSDHPDRHGRGDQPVPHDARLRRHEGGAAEPHRVTVEVPEAQRHHRQHRQPWHRRDPGVEQFYRQEASRRGWGEDWAAIEAGVLAEILDNPVGRLGRPSEVADLVAFVASPPLAATSTAPTCASTVAAPSYG